MKLNILKRVIFVPVIAGFTVLASSVSQAHQGGFMNGGDMHPKKQIMKMMRQLDLTMQQKMAVRTTLRDTRDEMSVVKEDLQQMRSEMFELIQSGNISQQSIDAVLDQYAPSLRQMSKTAANTRGAIYAVLDDGQREKAQELMANRQARLESRDPEQRLNKVAEKLEFSEQQLASATELLPEIVDARSGLRETLKSYRQGQRDLITSNSLTDEQLDELFDEHFPEFKTSVLTAIEAHQQLFQLLTDKQKAKIKGKRARLFMPRAL